MVNAKGSGAAGSVRDWFGIGSGSLRDWFGIGSGFVAVDSGAGGLVSLRFSAVWVWSGRWWFFDMLYYNNDVILSHLKIRYSLSVLSSF